MLVCVDCSQVGTTARQELFMASRDRLKQGRYYNELRADIISLLKSDSDISQMNQEYKGRIIRETGEDRDLVESIFSQLKNNKDIRGMFADSKGAFSFFNKKTAKPVEQPKEKEKDKEKAKKNLKRYPSVFKVKGFDKDNEDYIGSTEKLEITRKQEKNKVYKRFLCIYNTPKYGISVKNHTFWGR